ncbi:MAG: transposase [Candidatus Krumholzibacteria bacterium]|nr:transposase [Candidatus Krumholzibacteria bacterium]
MTCARPPLAQQRLGRLNDEQLVYSLRRPTVDGRTELILTPLELLDRLAHLVTPPRIHKHRYCGVLAPNAKLRRAVTASAGPAGATLQAIEQARLKMALTVAEDTGVRPLSADDDVPRSAAGRLAARCWALLLARIYECLPLLCPRCSQPMRIIAFILDPPVIERILTHIGEPATPPAVLPARAPPQAELGFEPTDPPAGQTVWPEIDQTGGRDSWD